MSEGTTNSENQDQKEPGGDSAPLSKDVTMPLSAVPERPLPSGGLISRPKITLTRPGVTKIAPTSPATKAPSPAKSQTSRIPVDQAKRTSETTVAVPAIPAGGEASLHQTMRIEALPDGIHAPEVVSGGLEALGKTRTIPPPPAASNQTMRIEAVPEEKSAVIPPAAMNQTMRITPSASGEQAEGGNRKADGKDASSTTQSIALDAILKPEFHPETKKEKTSRISLDAAMPSQDVLKRRTGKISIPVPPPKIPPMTGPDSTLKIKKPALGSQPAKPTTGPIIAPIGTPSGAPADGDSGKTKKLGTTSTLKLDLPSELKSSMQPKIMAIKRSESSGGLKVKKQATTPDASSDEPSISLLNSLDEETETEEIPVVYAVVALLTVLLSMVVLYVLMGQTFAPDLPFAGRL